jgi:hypothetical protein
MARRLFLERRTYRQSRLQDAARLVPILGLILIFGPIFIRDDTDAGGFLGSSLIYYFSIWLGLIVLTAVLSRALARSGPAEGDPPETAADEAP